MDEMWGSWEHPVEAGFGLAWHCGQRILSQLQCDNAEGAEQLRTGTQEVEDWQGRQKGWKGKGWVCQLPGPAGEWEPMEDSLSGEGPNCS